MTILSIPEKYTNDVNKIQKMHYEVNGRKNIIVYMLDSDMKNQPVFNEMWEEYLNYLMKYDAAKQEFTSVCVNKLMEEQNVSGQTWNIDFDKNELTIYD